MTHHYHHLQKINLEIESTTYSNHSSAKVQVITYLHINELRYKWSFTYDILSLDAKDPSSEPHFKCILNVWHSLVLLTRSMLLKMTIFHCVVIVLITSNVQSEITHISNDSNNASTSHNVLVNNPNVPSSKPNDRIE